VGKSKSRTQEFEGDIKNLEGGKEKKDAISVVSIRTTKKGHRLNRAARSCGQNQKKRNGY